jgi:transcriptional regulator with XRE-family HTH domain
LGEKNNREHVSERFGRLLDLHRKADGTVWGGQDLERATGGVVSRSYVSNLRNGRVGSPGLDKLAAIAGAMSFPPQLWFGGGTEPGQPQDEFETLVAALDDATVRAIIEEVVQLNTQERSLLLGIARQIAKR